jgi:hypothetical protein
MMQALNRKLVRDVLHLRSQVIAVALVVACGMATYVTMNSAFQALLLSQDSYYRDYHEARRRPGNRTGNGKGWHGYNGLRLQFSSASTV